MIVLTGAAGFIGSCMLSKLNEERFYEIVIVDEFSTLEKSKNYLNKKFIQKVSRENFSGWIQGKENQIQIIIHLGARTDTTETDTHLFDTLNYHYSQEIWQICANHQIPLIYASSAATYGAGEHGFCDQEEQLHKLAPLNAYGKSKHQFDLWAIAQDKQPFFWAGLKFFNVYGPNEYHKGRMASVIFHAYHQIKKTNKLKLFKSHKEAYKDGEQKRDFIYVKDIVEVIFFLMNTRRVSGIFNLGTGKSRTFNDLAKAVFLAIDVQESIEYIDTPKDIREKYQYFTEAQMDKLITIGYDKNFCSLEDGIKDYVKNYLIPCKYY